ncbi:MAG TPA: MinD/ParA family protein [Phycisphaerae bacterium]|nr:MinD/ParA family protein [Phycisphaerae bacterium]HNU46174.1 MinD/ParA family protein [Phycisphaerae bacterium]
MTQQTADIPRADQATRLRSLARHRARRAWTLAVTSGKGGVGKTNIAVNLSICLAARGLRVTLVDVDMGLANADLLMNLRTRYTLAHVLSGVRTVSEIVTPAPGGVKLVPGASGLEQVANLSDFERQSLIAGLRRLEHSTDIVVLDCGAGISRNVTAFASSADEVLVVTTPEPTALADAYAMIKVLNRDSYPGQVGLFVNMVESRAQARAAYRRLAEVATRFLNCPVADRGYMLHDTCVEQAVQHRCPFVIRSPGCNAAACIAATAAQVVRMSPTAQRGGGFFQRVVGLFV